MTDETLTNNEWNQVQEYNAEHIGEMLDAINETGRTEIVVETEKYIVIAEDDAHHSHGVANHLDLNPVKVQNTMLQKAKKLTDYDWGYAAPYVIEKPATYRAGEKHLLRQIAERTDTFGSVARAVDTLAVDQYGYSQSDWAKESGRDRSTVSRTTNN